MYNHFRRIIFMKEMSLPDKIIMFLEKHGRIFYNCLYHPSKILYHQMEVLNEIDRKVFYNALARMKNQGYLQEVEEKGKKRIKVTLKGKVKVFKHWRKSRKWDGKWRIVIFDIPETKKKMRNFFREKLQELGYRKLQESVWISPYNIANKTEELIELCRAKHYVHYLLVEELDNREILTKLFKLTE